MGVRKFRSVADLSAPARLPPLDPGNLPMALGLATLAHGLAPRHAPAGVRKFRSWDEALERRADWARTQGSTPAGSELPFSTDPDGKRSEP